MNIKDLVPAVKKNVEKISSTVTEKISSVVTAPAKPEIKPIKKKTAQKPVVYNKSKGNTVYHYKWRFGDRRDGWKLRTINPINKFMPFIMPMRCDATNTYSDDINISEVEKFVRKKVKEGKTNMSVLHIVIAAYLRTIAEYPAINRFCVGRKIYARKDIQVAMVIKREMKVASPDTCIKVWLQPTDTVDDVYDKLNTIIEMNKGQGESDFDAVNKVFTMVPDWLINVAARLVVLLDNYGLMPTLLTDVSPFHGSMIVTSMGSLGIHPIYHHIYNFGTLPLFLSYGKKKCETYTDTDGTVKTRKMIGLKAVTDERICDGYQYAAAFKLMKKYIEHPHMLEKKPTHVNKDID